MIPDSATRLAFGDFVFDRASGDLHRNGTTSRLAPQVAAVLAMLAGRPGDVVTRNELRDALWPDTTVEFDQGLNFCIRQLRVALSDDPSQPKYIETLHRRGYRFVAAVAAASTLTVEPADVTLPIGLDAERAPRPPRRWIPTSVGALAVGLVLVAVSLFSRNGASSPASSPRIAVLAFDRPADTTLAAYQNQLAELIVASVGRGQLDHIAVMGPSFTARFAGSATPPDSIRDAIGATHVLSGTLRVDGRVVSVFAQLIQTNDRRHLWAARFVDSTGAVAGSQIISIADTIARAATKLVVRDHL